MLDEKNRKKWKTLRRKIIINEFLSSNAWGNILHGPDS